MSGIEVDRVIELRDIIAKSNSMSEIYRCCKEVVRLNDGYEVKIVPNDPTKSAFVIGI